MDSYGSQEPLLMIVGEAPGEDEDIQGRPFVGKAGKLLRQVLKEMEIDIEANVRFTNVVRCRPPMNKITSKAIDYCSQFALEDIKTYKPEMVFVMGNSPLSGILGESGISNWSGTLIEKSDAVYVPLYHPAYLLRNPQAMDPWLEAIMQALDRMAFGKTSQSAKMKYIYPKTISEVDAMVKYLDEFEFISFDTEVRSLDPFDENNLLVAVSFAAGEQAYSIPVHHKEASWKPEEIGILMQRLRKVLKDHDGSIIGHNMKFDQQIARTLMKCQFRAGGDTMLQSYLLDCRKGIHGLKRLAGIHVGMFEYDSELVSYIKTHKEANPRRGGSYEHIPLKILLPYSAKDAAATLLLDEKLYEMLSEKQRVVYEELLIPASDMLSDVESNGFKIDDFIADRYRRIYQKRKNDLFKEILDDSLVNRLTKFHNRRLEEEVDPKKRKRKAKVFVFNPGSAVHMMELVYKFGKIKVEYKTEKGAPCTKAAVLKLYEKQMPILKTIRYYKLLTNMLSKYLEPACDGEWISSMDGRVHSNFNLNGTKTGRLSSSDPNLQNIPTPEKEPGTLLETLPIKNIFRNSYEGGVLLGADQSGMELRVFASLSKCKPMLDILASDKDFHTMVASMVVSMMKHEDVPPEQIDKSTRYKYKRVNWTLLYGGDEHTLSKLDGMDIKEATVMVKSYFERFPEVPEYMNTCVEFSEDHGYIESPIGRRLALYYINDRYQKKLQASDRRTAVNMPVQSAASDLVLCVSIVLSKELRRRRMKTMLVNTVHDSVVLDVPPEEVNEVAAMVKYAMENIVEVYGKYFPRLDLSWMICPMKADAETGTHYGAEEKYNVSEEYIQKEKALWASNQILG